MKETMKMSVLFKDLGTVTIQLWPSLAPLAIAGMERVASMGKYNDHPVERLEPGFVLQPLFCDGVDEDIDRMVEPEFRTIPENHAIPFRRGLVAMAGDAEQASGSQYFICLKEKERLNGNFTVVGEVVDGWNVLEEIENRGVEECVDEPSGFIFHRPKKPIIVECVTIGD